MRKEGRLCKGHNKVNSIASVDRDRLTDETKVKKNGGLEGKRGGETSSALGRTSCHTFGTLSNNVHIICSMHQSDIHLEKLSVRGLAAHDAGVLFPVVFYINISA